MLRYEYFERFAFVVEVQFFAYTFAFAVDVDPLLSVVVDGHFVGFEVFDVLRQFKVVEIE